MSFPDVPGISVDSITAIIGIFVAALVYVFKQWWEEAKRVSSLREQVYLNFGKVVGQLEACLVLGDAKKVDATFAELSSMVVEFHLFASGRVNSEAGAYLSAIARIIATASEMEFGSPASIKSLNDARNRVMDAMRSDVLWLSRPFFRSGAQREYQPQNEAKIE